MYFIGQYGTFCSCGNPSSNYTCLLFICLHSWVSFCLCFPVAKPDVGASEVGLYNAQIAVLKKDLWPKALVILQRLQDQARGLADAVGEQVELGILRYFWTIDFTVDGRKLDSLHALACKWPVYDQPCLLEPGCLRHLPVFSEPFSLSLGLPAWPAFLQHHSECFGIRRALAAVSGCLGSHEQAAWPEVGRRVSRWLHWWCREDVGKNCEGTALAEEVVRILSRFLKIPKSEAEISTPEGAKWFKQPGPPMTFLCPAYPDGAEDTGGRRWGHGEQLHQCSEALGVGAAFVGASTA